MQFTEGEIAMIKLKGKSYNRHERMANKKKKKKKARREEKNQGHLILHRAIPTL